LLRPPGGDVAKTGLSQGPAHIQARIYQEPGFTKNQAMPWFDPARL
jgi:hypothetical protein